MELASQGPGLEVGGRGGGVPGERGAAPSSRARGATTLFPAQFEAIARTGENEYVLSLRTYRKSDPSHFQPHRAAHGVNGHDAAFDEARPHFHAWPLSEKVSVAQEGDYPKAGEAVRVDSWGMEVYGIRKPKLPPLQASLADVENPNTPFPTS